MQVSTASTGDCRRWIHESIVVLVLAVLVVGIVVKGKTDYTMTDPLGTLLFSQNLLQHGTFELDAYREYLEENYGLYSYRLHVRGGHVLPFYPPGPIVFSVPAVWVVNLLGKDMTVIVDGRPLYDTLLQRYLAAAIVAACFGLVYLLCRCYLRPGASVLLALVLTLGSSMSSTLGNALWNYDFEIAFMLLGLLLIVWDERGLVPNHLRRAVPYALACCVTAAFICRPPAAIFVALVSIVVWRKSQADFSRLAFAGMALLVVLVTFSYHFYGKMLPPYYSRPEKFVATSQPWVALYGVWLSPSRGILIFSPFLLLTFAGLIRFARPLFRSPLVWLCVGWFILHSALMASYNEWWGGHSYGPRLMADAYPALVLLTILVWDAAANSLQPAGRRVAAGVFTVLAAVAIWINAYQGLYNVNTAWWNAYVDVDAHPERAMDWRIPQFLADRDMLDRIKAETGSPLP